MRLSLPPGVHRRRLLLGLAACGLGAAASGACRAGGEAVGSQPLPLRVEVAGCQTVLRGPRCVVPDDRRLRLWVAADPESDLTINGESPRPVSPALLGGSRFEVEIGEGIGELLVEARRGPAVARFQWSLAESSRPAWYHEARGRARAGDDAAARRLVEPRATSASAAERGLALRLLARLDRRQGKREDEERHLRQAVAALEESGLVFDALEDSIVLASLWLPEWRLAEVRALLASLQVVEGHAESAYLLALYQGLLAGKSGDLRTALRALTSAAEQAERAGHDENRIQAEQVLARELHRLGRLEEAAALFARLPLGGVAASRRPCLGAQIANNHAWSLLLAREAGLEVDSPEPLLRQALELFDGECRDFPQERINVRINLALAHLQEGRLGVARTWLDQARALSPEPLPELMLWAWDIEARIRLAEARPQEALALYDALAARARDALSPEAEWRLAYWRAQTLEAMGDVGAALASYAHAEDLLDREALLVPMHQGRDTLIGQRRRATQRQLELLLEAGEDAEALAVARRASSRYLRSLRRFVRVEHLSAEERASWDQALAKRQALREELDRAVAGAWRLSGEELGTALAGWSRALRGQVAELDELLAELGGSVGRGPEPLPRPDPGEVILAYYPLAEDWVGFAADAQGAVAQRIEGVDEGLAQHEELARRLLAPFAAEIERARTVRVLASGPLAGVDFHALPFRGDVLLAAKSVVYGLDLPEPRAAQLAEPSTALLLADPAGDLPGARKEAESVADALRARRPGWAVRHLVGPRATSEAARGALPASGLLHFAGHTAFDGWDSFLPLAEGNRLMLDDVLALDPAPVWVVLSGCETAATSPYGGVETLGLAHAFLAAGSRAVIAAMRPVPDRVAAALMPALYREWGPETPPPEALRRAQLALRTADPDADWASFRAVVP